MVTRAVHALFIDHSQIVSLSRTIPATHHLCTFNSGMSYYRNYPNEINRINYGIASAASSRRLYQPRRT